MENLEPNSPRCSVQGAATRLDILRTTRLTNNCKVIKEIASDMNVSLDTDMISEIFTSPQWNAKKAGMLNLAMHGIISIIDKRVEVLPEADIIDTEKVTDELTEKEWNAEEDTTKE